MGAVVDVEIAERGASEAEDWVRRWADATRRPGVGGDSACTAVDCAVCGRTHSPGTDDDPGCHG